jgi:hypothetical protein
MTLYSALVSSVQGDIASRFCLTQQETDEWLFAVQQGIADKGIQFLTVTLPSIGKLLDRSLQGDTWFEYSDLIPKTLYLLVWGHNGFIRSNAGHPAAEVIRALRQFVYLFYKLELPFTPLDELKVVYEFIETDRNLPGSFDLRDPILRRARAFCTRLFSKFNPRNIIPRHGPGAVSTGEKISEKGEFKRIYRTLERFYPFTEYFMYSLSHVTDYPDWLQSRETLEHGTAKVVLVPKDSRGPRLISCEPLELQWIQQGLASSLMQYIERNPLTSGFVNFTDQSVNQWLALVSSQTGDYVTLDMKEASDRVSLSLVERLFSGTQLYEALLACRSAATKLPSGEVLGLRKFAPMGSACCFPIEAMCFYALALAVLSAHYMCSMQECVGRVYVYGDDIICKREDYALLLQSFPQFGLLFNSGKCCIRGFFRESCGTDAFRGVDVTPLKVRTVWSSSKSVHSLVSYVAYTNTFHKLGYWRTRDLLRRTIVSKYGAIPYTMDECPSYIAFITDTPCKNINKTLGFKYRFNRKIQVLEILADSIDVKSVRSRCHSDYAEMLRSTLVPSEQGHGLHPDRRRVYLQRRWSRA